MEEPLQKSLDRYDVLDRIAVGGMAEVFLAKAYGAHGFEKTLAIKRILPELASDPEFAARFIAEAKVAVRLSHANVVQVFDFGRIGESLFIAMEYVDGLDLAALLRRFKDEKRLIPLPAAFHIAIEIIRALDFAHSHNVVHRDVSPSNILISRAGEVKLGDFGIAVAASPHKTSAPGPKRVMGKWRYMSPEQARGDTLDTRSDLFSAASVLFELFTGEKLFPGDEAEDILKNINEMPIPKLASLRPGLPSRLDDVLAGPLSRKPIDRPPRPAPVLRSLIELSYESSIMATAMDVAEAVAHVLPAKAPVGRGALDDVIRKQLAEQSVARQTAVTGKPPGTQTQAQAAAERGEVSTGLFRKIDIDGLSRLESEAEHEDQETNTRVGGPRARRTTEKQNEVPAADSGLHKLFDARVDPDRRTEVGPPPVTGQISKVDAESPPAGTKAPSTGTGSNAATGTSTTGSKSTTGTGAKSAQRSGSAAAQADVDAAASAERPKRGLQIGVAIALVAGIGIAAYVATRDTQPVVAADAAIVAPVVPDAPPSSLLAKLTINTTPPGAHGTVDDQPFTTTPVTLRVEPNVEHVVVIELAGYRTQKVTIPATNIPTANTHFSPQYALVEAPATVQITTTPAGAKVVVNGTTIGETPVGPVDVDPKAKSEILVTKADYEPLKLVVDLEAGKPYQLTRELKAAQKFGVVEFALTGVKVASVIIGGRDYGPTATPSGPRQIKLPVGQHRVTLKTPSQKTQTVTIEVGERGVTKVPVAF